MISTKELFKTKQYPKWISSHPIFSKLEYIRKVFPSIGLSNFENKSILNNSKEITEHANQLLTVILETIENRYRQLKHCSTQLKMSRQRHQKLEQILCIMSALSAQMRSHLDGAGCQCVSFTPNGKASLIVPQDIKINDTVLVKSGAGIFKLYEKITKLLTEYKFLPLPAINTFYQFKNFSSINVPGNEKIIKFNSDGADGIWDISTMSMRGFTSCQTWDQGVGGNSYKLIGSMIDPFTGIIYLTNNDIFNQFGSKMIRRCIVRYAINVCTKQPCLLLEKMYPTFDKPSLDAFITALRAHTDLNIEYSGYLGEKATNAGSSLANIYIPLSDELKLIESKYYPYCDSGVSFKDDPDCKLAKNTQTLHTAFKKNISELVKKAIQSNNFTQLKVKKYGVGAAYIMSQLRKKSKTPAVAETKDNLDASGLGNKFVDFVCKKTEHSDPFNYLWEHEDKCAAFFKSEFENKTNKAFVNFLSQNIFDYIDEQTSKQS